MIDPITLLAKENRLANNLRATADKATLVQPQRGRPKAANEAAHKHENPRANATAPVKGLGMSPEIIAASRSHIIDHSLVPNITKKKKTKNVRGLPVMR
jgi:hypothetical protein